MTELTFGASALIGIFLDRYQHRYASSRYEGLVRNTSPSSDFFRSRQLALFAEPNCLLTAKERLAEAMCRTGDGDRDAFRELYRLTSAKLFGICLRICRDRGAAEDVLHDVYLTVWRRAGGWDAQRGSAITWLAAIARNRSIDWLRVQRKESLDIGADGWDGIADPTPSAEASLLTSEERRRLHHSMNSLEPRTRDAIRDAFFGGATYSELARRNDIPLGTMKSLIRRGLAKLKVDMDRSTEPGSQFALTYQASL